MEVDKLHVIWSSKVRELQVYNIKEYKGPVFSRTPLLLLTCYTLLRTLFLNSLEEQAHPNMISWICITQIVLLIIFIPALVQAQSSVLEHSPESKRLIYPHSMMITTHTP